MRVTDHTNYQSGQDMYCKRKQPDQAGLSRQVTTENKSDNKITDSINKSTKRETKSPVADRFGTFSHSTLYSSTPDLMAIANTENQEVLRAIYIRLSFKLWSVRAAGVTNTNKKAIKNATRSIEKVMGKVKGKIKNLQKEDEMEKKAEAARKAKLRRLQQELRRELAIKRKIRKNKERKDVEESYLESDGQYSVKSYRDSLPEEIQLQLELQQAGTAGAIMTEASLAATDITMAIDSSAISMSSEAAVSSIAGDAGGAFVNLAL